MKRLIIVLSIVTTLVNGQGVSSSINIASTLSRTGSGGANFTIGTIPVELSAGHVASLSIMSQLVNYLGAGVNPKSNVPMIATLMMSNLGPEITWKVGKLPDMTVRIGLDTLEWAQVGFTRVRDAVSSTLLRSVIPNPSIG